MSTESEEVGATSTQSSRPVQSWDPYQFLENRAPTSDCLRRIRTDIKALFKNPLPGIYAVPDLEYATLVHAIIVGPFGTPYEGGFFYFILNFPDNFPHEPPKVKLITTGGGRVRFNPNLYADGKVCLSILGTWSGPGWSLVQSLSSVLLSIQSLMSEKPYLNEPGFEQSETRSIESYNDCIRHETLRVAVLEMIENTDLHHSLPRTLKDVINSLYPSFMESYIITCNTNVMKDGQ
eukprot:gene12562-26455_t